MSLNGNPPLKLFLFVEKPCQHLPLLCGHFCPNNGTCNAFFFQFHNFSTVRFILFITWQCLSVHHCGGGGPHPIPGLAGGYPIPDLAGGGGVPHPRSGQGGTPSQVWPGGYPYPDLRWGTPPPHLDLGWGTRPTQTWDGVPPLPRPGTGYPPTWDGAPPLITHSSIATTCYVAGGVPLAFTQEDFLVLFYFIFFFFYFILFYFFFLKAGLEFSIRKNVKSYLMFFQFLFNFVNRPIGFDLEW